MKVWVVTHWSLCEAEETTDVVAVFATEAEARKYAKDNLGFPANHDYFVTEKEIVGLDLQKIWMDGWEDGAYSVVVGCKPLTEGDAYVDMLKTRIRVPQNLLELK